MKFNAGNYPQYRIGLLAESEQQIEKRDVVFDNTTIIGHVDADNFLITDFPCKISELIMKTNMLLSKSEFNRKLKEGAIRIGLDWGLEDRIWRDIILDINCKEVSIRIGKRFLEFLNCASLTNMEEP